MFDFLRVLYNTHTVFHHDWKLPTHVRNKKKSRHIRFRRASNFFFWNLETVYKETALQKYLRRSGIFVVDSFS